MHICRMGPSRSHVEPQDDDLSSLEPKASPCMAHVKADHYLRPRSIAVLAFAGFF